MICMETETFHEENFFQNRKKNSKSRETFQNRKKNSKSRSIFQNRENVFEIEKYQNFIEIWKFYRNLKFSFKTEKNFLQKREIFKKRDNFFLKITNVFSKQINCIVVAVERKNIFAIGKTFWTSRLKAYTRVYKK